MQTDIYGGGEDRAICEMVTDSRPVGSGRGCRCETKSERASKSESEREREWEKEACVVECRGRVAKRETDRERAEPFGS